MLPLSRHAVHIFALIAANVGNNFIHLHRLITVAREPRTQVEAALIELTSRDYIRYDLQTQHIFINKDKYHGRKHNDLGTA